MDHDGYLVDLSSGHFNGHLVDLSSGHFDGPLMDLILVPSGCLLKKKTFMGFLKN